MKRINTKFATLKKCYHLCVFQSEQCALMLLSRRPRPSFWITANASSVLTSAKQSIANSVGTPQFICCNQSHFCCKCWLNSLDVTLFGWFGCLRPKMADKMSQWMSNRHLGDYPICCFHNPLHSDMDYRIFNIRNSYFLHTGASVYSLVRRLVLGVVSIEKSGSGQPQSLALTLRTPTYVVTTPSCTYLGFLRASAHRSEPVWPSGKALVW